MERKIRLRIDGSFLKSDAVFAGVTGEGNVTTLDIELDESWSGLSKSITYYNAHGENPVQMILTADKMTDNAGRRYAMDIPPEPLECEGIMSFVIEGWEQGKRQRSIAGELEVRYAPASGGVASADPTPSQTEQLQGQIEGMLGAFVSCRDETKLSAQNAKQSEVQAGLSAQAAADSANEVAQNTSKSAIAAEAAATAAFEAQVQASKAEESATEAYTAADNAIKTAGNSAKLAESWAVGGTGTRTGENSDNSKYYAERAAQDKTAAEISASGAALSKAAGWVYSTPPHYF